MPTGAGKSITATAIADGLDALWLVHTRALRDQAPGRAVTVQALLGGARPRCDLLIADECHHLASGADRWLSVAKDYPKILGLTATPCRGDGAPLGELFQEMVVGASYSELLAGGWLVPCRVVRPLQVPEESGIADEPLRAWKKWAAHRAGFAFFGRVELARRFARGLNPSGGGAGQLGLFSRPRCGTVTGDMDDDERNHILDSFRSGALPVLSSVQCLTEGVDLPGAEVCMLARSVSHEGAYLQAVGRVLRPAPGKTEAVLIDLPGASFRFGLPTDDRVYGLSGEAVSRAAGSPSLSQCQRCGACYPAAPRCPECGFEAPKKPPKVRIWGIPLEEVDRSQLSVKDRSKLAWRAKMEADPEAKRAWFMRQVELAARKGWKPGAAACRYKAVFGAWPPREWR
jgi:superfamily II DNA or RNA helicase